MNKCKLKFVISHLKQAIWNLETANKLDEENTVVDDSLMEQLKVTLIYYQHKLKEAE